MHYNSTSVYSRCLQLRQCMGYSEWWKKSPVTNAHLWDIGNGWSKYSIWEKKLWWVLISFLEVYTWKKRSSIKSELSRLGLRSDYTGVSQYIGYQKDPDLAMLRRVEIQSKKWCSLTNWIDKPVKVNVGAKTKKNIDIWQSILDKYK